MEISALFVSLIIFLDLWELNSTLPLNDFVDDLKQRAESTKNRVGAVVSTQASSVKCLLQGATLPPAFSMDGDYVIGGVFAIHLYKRTVKHNYTTMPEPVNCRGRLVRGRSGG